MAAGTTIASLLVSLGADTRALENGLKKSESLLAHTAGAFAKAGQALTMGLTLPLVGVGLGAAKMAVDFDSAMMGVNSVLKLSEDKFRDLKGEILAFSTETSKSSADVAIALRGIVSTGFESADAMDILKVAVDSAGNMMVDTSTTTLALTSTLKAFGMEATEVTHVADVLQTAANNSAIQFDLLTTSIGTALGSAAAAGVSFEETAAALMTITDAGYSTQIATTNLNAVISALLKPGEDLTTMIAAWGYESGEAALKAIGLQGVMALLTEATGGSASELAVLLPNVRAFKGAVALAREDGAAFADSLDEIAAASVGAGEHAAMAAIRHESWAYQITKLKSEVEVFANRLAGVFMPAVIDIVNVLKDWATTLATLDPEMLKTIVTIAGIAAAVGPVLVVFAKLVAIGISVASGLSMLASGIETVIIGVSLLTGAGTMLGAALMTIAPIAVVAGLALLAKKVYDNIQAHKEFAAEAIHVSSTFTEYRQAVEDSDRWTTTLSEDVWELVQAQIELRGATGEAAAALAAHGIEQQKLLDAMQKASELQAGMSGHIAREVHERGEAAKAIILQDAALRAVALSMGLVTQAEFDLVEGVEASDRAMLEFAKNTQELREQTGFYAEAIKNVSAEQEQLNEQMARTSAQTERAAQITKTSLDEMAAAAKEARESLGETFENLGSTISSGYEQMQASADTYHAAMLSAQTDYDEQMAQIAEKGAQAQFLALEKYQLSQAQALGKYEAEAAALSAAGQTDRLADLTRSFDESSTIAQYAFDMAEAQREQSEAIQTHVAQVAQAQREYDAALSHFNELSELQKFIGNKIMMWIALHKSEIDIAGGSADDMLRTVGEMFGSQLSLADQFNIGWKAFMKDWAEDSGKAIEGAATYWEGLHLTMKGELDKGAATMAAAQSRLDAIGAGWEPPALQAPAMPDFSQWTQEYSSGVSRGGSQIRESATKTLQQVTVDIAKAFETAMTVFEKVAGWKPLKGLAAGMKALREDIQLAVKEMYTAYQALGEEGVKGAGLMAEAATAVLATIGQAVDTFGKLEGYTAPLRPALDSLLDNIRYVLVKVRTELLDLWGWAGDRKDTVWGHMESWAGSVGGVLDVVSTAVTTFTNLKDYTGIMPGIIDLLVADIQAVLQALESIGAGPIDQAKLAWAEFAGKLLSTVASMIEDLRAVAAYKGDIEVSSLNVSDLVWALSAATYYIVKAMGVIPGIFDEGADAARQMYQSWLAFATGLVSTLAGAIEDLRTVAGFANDFTINSLTVSDLVWALSAATYYIVKAMDVIPGIFDEGAQTARAMYQSWLDFATGLIATLAGAIEDLRTVAAYAGDIQVGFHEVQQLVWQIDVTARNILGAIETVASDFDAAEGSVDQLEAAWLEFSGGLISTVAGAIEDLKTIAAYGADIQVGFHEVQQLVWQIDVTARNILGAIETVASDFSAAEGSVDQLEAAWLEFSAGLIATVAGVISDLETLAAFEGDLEVSTESIENLVSQLEATANEILRVLTEAGVPDITAEGALEPLRAAWAEFASGLVGAVAGAIDSLIAIGDYVGVSNIIPAVQKLVADLQGAINTITTELASVSWTDANAAATIWVTEAATLLGHVEGVVSSMEAIAAYEGESLAQQLKALVKKLTEAVNYITTDFPTITVPEGLATSATNAVTILGHIGKVTSSMETIAAYEGESLAQQLRALVRNLAQAISYITTDFPTIVVTDDVIQLLADVQVVAQGIRDVLNALSGLSELNTEVPSLAEVGAQLVQALADGFVEATSTAAPAMMAALTGLLATIQGYLQSFAGGISVAGWNIGGSLIQGMINGLAAGMSALYTTIANITAGSVGAAQAAAGVASDSTKMWELGQNMVSGLVGGLAAGQSDVAAAMAGLMGGGMGMQAAPVMAGGGPGGGASNTYNYNYNYNESDSITPEGRASLRQQYESIELYSRLRG